MKRFLLFTFCCFSLLAKSGHASAQVTAIGPVTLTVRDLNRSLAFYQDILGFRKIADTEYLGRQYEELEGLFGLRMRVATLRLGDESLQLVAYLTAGGRSIPEDARSNDLSFQHVAIVVRDMDEAYRLLRSHGVEHVSTAPQTIPADNIAAAGVRAFYFHDPDRHNLELIWFPPGKGQPKWQHPTNAAGLFLGIDHTAIAITRTDSSLAFYRDLLGIQPKGESWNKGAEQAHLNFVEGASLHITGLRAASGPGVEFLQYLYPAPGKPYPADTRADDLWHWQTTLYTNDASTLFTQCAKMHRTLVSTGLVTFHDTNGKDAKCFIVRDPDGHALLITEKTD
ncbi:MAG TPA: VOC family protein [Puia sp.]|uniref:VOC family protein n=1 Tax=Puia sp. TaxID=2045100 RepID=UPI002B630C62|nr:VOC family protein [Puia sp.]HVU94431.1 VOC family protein [Puia sp.]